MKTILGLDLGTNSIGWAVVKENKSQLTGIEDAGSRIIPMDAGAMGAFDSGDSISQTAQRTSYRSKRHLIERTILRRERLHRVLRIMNFLPKHYSEHIDRYGKFIKNSEPKLAWKKSKSGKYDFIFIDSFYEMLELFKDSHPEIYSSRKVPVDWTIYYLRKKALTRKISKEELSWILLNFNQKRGYYQLRGEADDTFTGKREEYKKLTIESVEDSGDKKGKSTWYNVTLSNGFVYKKCSDKPLDWVGKEKEFIITYNVETDGSIKKDKDGKEKYSIRMPKEDDWNLLKKKTETDIEDSQKNLGEFIFDNILSQPDQKIIGKLVRTIERRYYKQELMAILRKQKEFHPELNDEQLYKKCVDTLYAHNETYSVSISNRDFTYLFVDDIIFYQRPLKSRKHNVSNCPFEERYYIDKEKNEKICVPVKCIHKSHPVFQEFRLWQFVQNLKIYRNDGTNTDVTHEFFQDYNDIAKIYEWLNERNEIDQKGFLKEYLNLKRPQEYRWNYVEDKKYPCNRTRFAIASKFSNEEKKKLTPELLTKIWHLLYSVSTQEEINSVFTEDKLGENGLYYELRQNFSEESIQKLKTVKFDDDDYGAYSEKATRKLLAIMRAGKYWHEDMIDSCTCGRIEKLLSGEFDKNINNRVREKVKNFSAISDFQGLPLWLAIAIVYDEKPKDKWDSPKDIDNYLKSFRQHSLRNPVVEQIVTETLRIVREIWKKHNTIDEIHIELGREIKSTKEQRIRMTRSITENERTNERIRTLLKEFMDPEYGIDGVRPYSHSQHELLKIYEEGALYKRDYDNTIPEERKEEIRTISRKFSESDNAKRPTKREILKYKLWLDQNYISPYTGQPIPLSKLFTREYEIEHIIPQSRYFDDSFNNKVICETEVNKLKDNQLGFEFIRNHRGEIVTLNNKKKVVILDVDQYKENIRKQYYANKIKLRNLLLDDIPDEFINRQMNDSRYIAKFITALLSNIVREEIAPGEFEPESTSKNIIVCNGQITTRLKQDWGISNVWNQIVIPRFERMNNICETNEFTCLNSEGHLIPAQIRGLNKKRIDHRHHAMDAIVIACATREHVNLLSNEAAKSGSKEMHYALSHKLRRYESVIINGKKRYVAKEFIAPWATFQKDMKIALDNIIISFKQNLRVINKTVNYYCSYYDEQGNLRLDKNGKPRKEYIAQERNSNWWAIRKSLHKEMFYGKVALRKSRKVRLCKAIQNPELIVDKDLKKEILRLLSLGYDEKGIKKYFNEGANKDIWAEVNFNKIECYYFTDNTFAIRKPVGELQDIAKGKTAKEIFENSVNWITESITDTGIQKILIRHLQNNDGDPKVAFSPDGIEKMNENIRMLNHGNEHKPIYKVRVYEAGNRFPLGERGNKCLKYVETAKGTNLYFGIYVDKNNARFYDTISLNKAIDRMKRGESPVPEITEDGKKLLFYLSPNDLVYLPDREEIKNGWIENINNERIYKMVSCTGNELYCIPSYIASPIMQTKELGSNNKAQKAWTDEMIKEICIPLKVNRLGHLMCIGKEYLPKVDVI